MLENKCQPQKHPHAGRCLCQCLQEFNPQRLFCENIADIKNALYEIMVICGVHPCKANAAKELILNAFKHYNEQRQCLEESEKKSISKDFFIRELGCKCMMTCMEAQLSYAIIKRAIKAFFNGPAIGIIRNPIIEAQQIVNQESQWLRAGKRTVQIFDEYAGILFPKPINFEQRIRNVYKELYERMKERASPVILESCCGENCVKRVVPTKLPKTNGVLDDDFSLLTEDSNITAELKTTKKKLKKIICLEDIQAKENFEKLPRCTKCKSLKLMCYCNVDLKTGILNLPCSQDEFKLRWKLVDDIKPDPCINKPGYHVCPIHCDELSEMTIEDSDMGMRSGDYCVCAAETETDTDADDDDRVEDDLSTEVSETLTICSCHLPEPDFTPIMLEDKSPKKICVKAVNQKVISKTKSNVIKPKPCKVKKVLKCCCPKLESMAPKVQFKLAKTESCRLLGGANINISEKCCKSADFLKETKVVRPVIPDMQQLNIEIFSPKKQVIKRKKSLMGTKRPMYRRHGA